MKREVLKELLGENATDEIIDAIMAANGKDVNNAKAGAEDLRSKLAEATSRLTELEDAANANLSDKEKQDKALEEALNAAERATHDLNEMCAVAEFAKAGLTEEEYKPFLASVVGSDRKQTVAAAQAITNVINLKAAAAKEAAEKAALANMGAPAAGEQTSSIPTTKAEFAKLGYAKQMELKTQNPNILSELS